MLIECLQSSWHTDRARDMLTRPRHARQTGDARGVRARLMTNRTCDDKPDILTTLQHALDIEDLRPPVRWPMIHYGLAERGDAPKPPNRAF
jgi:hypothetical protein